MAEVVAVTGASGFIGSWVVRLLLDRGYAVNAAVRDIADPKETDHLLSLPGAATEPRRIRFFSVDLLDPDSLHALVRGATGVIHVASPCTVNRVDDPEVELLRPAIEGTLHVLRAAKAAGARRVVVTSSISAIVPSPSWPAGEIRDERCWADVEYCKTRELWYPLSKTLAEKAAWEFAEKEGGVDVVVVNPGTVMGPILPPVINASMDMFLRLIQGCTEEYADFYMGPVHVEDVALAHVLLYENKSASGRHLCVQSIVHWSDFASKVVELYPDHKVPSFPTDTQPGLVRALDASKKLIAMGIKFRSMEEIIKDSRESLESKGYIS